MFRLLKNWLPPDEDRVRPEDQDASLAVPFGPAALHPPGADGNRLAIICHLFYPELAPEFLAYFCNVEDAHVFISTDTQAKAERIQSAFAAWPRDRLEVRLAPNRGRDVAPKFITFADVWRRYDLVLCVHGKKSPHFDGGDTWRHTLMSTLAGSPATVASVKALFAADPKLGLVFPQHYPPIRPYVAWGDNFDMARAFGKRLGVKVSRRSVLDIASGSMFWARPSALGPLLDLRLTVDEFPDEAAQTNATLAHVIERLLLFVCERAGYRWIKIADSSAYAGDPTVAAVESRADMLRLVEEQQFRVTR